ncbi:MAG: ABC transporter permease [Clostridiales bacterium]|nr:ABC transporter permease [Clostridiales bacterium]
MKGKWKTIQRQLVQREEIGIVVTLLVVMAIFGVLKPTFLGRVNLIRLLRQGCILSIMAIGISFVISSNGMDVSVGAVLAVCATIVAQMQVDGRNMYLSIAAAVAAGGLLGLINGLIVTKLHIKELIATLGTSYLIRGLLLQISGAKWLTNLPRPFKFIGQGDWLGIPVPVFILAGVIVLTIFFSNYTPLGKQIRAIGGNLEAAKLTGVKADRVKALSFMLCGLLTGVASVVYASRMGSVQSNAGNGMEFEVISAALIGGASFDGSGSPIGAFLGAMLLTAISNGIVLLGISTYLEDVIIGLLILVALIVNLLRSRYEIALEVSGND